MLVDSNRGLIITDDTLNITYIKEKKKKDEEEVDLESALSPHFTAILECHDYYKKYRDEKKKEKKRKKKAAAAALEKSIDSTASAGTISEVSAMSHSVVGQFTGMQM